MLKEAPAINFSTWHWSSLGACCCHHRAERDTCRGEGRGGEGRGGGGGETLGQFEPALNSSVRRNNMRNKVRVFSRDILKGRNIAVLAGGGGSWGCIIFWKI